MKKNCLSHYKTFPCTLLDGKFAIEIDNLSKIRQKLLLRFKPKTFVKSPVF